MQHIHIPYQVYFNITA